MKPHKRVDIYENFLPQELYLECVKYSMRVFTDRNPKFRTNYNWDRYMVQDSFPVLIHDVTDGELFEPVKKLMEDATGGSLNMYWSIYYWTRFSFSPWHNDDNHNGGMTIYLNEYWDPNWGGAFMYEDQINNGSIDGVFQALYPKPNRAVHTNGGIRHHVSPITFGGNVRCTIQAFFN